MQQTKNIFRAPPTNVGGALLFSACPSVCPSVRGLSNSVIFNLISSKFHIWIASINLSFKFEYEFVQHSITKMADNMATTYQYPLSWSL